MSLGDRQLASTVVTNFTTTAGGTPTTLSGSPVISVYKNSTTESTTGITLTVDYDARTGMNHVVIDTSSDGTFYATGNDFSIVITTGTVGGVSVIGYVVEEFSIGKGNIAYLASQAITAAAGVTFPSSVASPTNITAGTIGTVTTLTNLPSIPANWLTAAGIASSALNGKGDWLLSASYSAPPTTAQISTSVWQDNASGSDFSIVGSIGKLLSTDIDAAISTRSTYAGGAVASVTGSVGSVADAGASLTAIGDSRIAHLNADVTSRMATYTQPTGFLAATFPTGTVANTTNITAGTITTVTNLTNAPTVGDLTATMKASVTAAVPSAATIATAVFATAVETSMTFLQYLKGTGAVLLGKLSGGATTTNIFRNAVDDTKARVTATVDSDGNRTAITTDFT